MVFRSRFMHAPPRWWFFLVKFYSVLYLLINALYRNLYKIKDICLVSTLNIFILYTRIVVIWYIADVLFSCLAICLFVYLFFCNLHFYVCPCSNINTVCSRIRIHQQTLDLQHRIKIILGDTSAYVLAEGIGTTVPDQCIYPGGRTAGGGATLPYPPPPLSQNPPSLAK